MVSTSATERKKLDYWNISIICLITIETALVMAALAPAQLWTRLYHNPRRAHWTALFRQRLHQLLLLYSILRHQS